MNEWMSVTSRSMLPSVHSDVIWDYFFYHLCCSTGLHRRPATVCTHFTCLRSVTSSSDVDFSVTSMLWCRPCIIHCEVRVGSFVVVLLNRDKTVAVGLIFGSRRGWVVLIAVGRSIDERQWLRRLTQVSRCHATFDTARSFDKHIVNFVWKLEL